MSELKLREFQNSKRFIECDIDCINCGAKTLEDHWPPNYGGSSGNIDAEGRSTYSYGGSMKHVCTSCKSFFTRHSGGMKTGNEPEQKTVSYSEIIPLVEKDGLLLTPNDVYREEYKEEHGEYPIQVYG